MIGQDPVQALWHPVDGPETVYLNWYMTDWCNYHCAYCGRKKDPKQHALRYASVKDWIDAFEKHFSHRYLSLMLTGGEPMIDPVLIVPLLRYFSEAPYVKAIRLDTNLSPHSCKVFLSMADLDWSKLFVMATFHPAHTKLDDFIQRIDSLLAVGIPVKMVNHVLTDETVVTYEADRNEFLKRGIPLHPNPLRQDLKHFDPVRQKVLQTFLSERDFPYKMVQARTQGQPCLFPSVGYEMQWAGIVSVGCGAWGQKTRKGNFLQDAQLPKSPLDYVPCPATQCSYITYYTFLETLGVNTSRNPMCEYVGRLFARWGGVSDGKR